MPDIAKVALRLFIIMIVAGLALGAAYTVTKDPIAEQAQLKQEEARRAVLSDAETFEPVEFSGSDAITDVYKGIDASGNPCGYAVTVIGSGFGGDITMTVGIKDETVTGIRISSPSETPGLGAKSSDEAFYGQFAGKSGKLSVNKNGATNDQEITAITAATITSTAVTNAVNEVLAASASLE